MAEHTRLEGRMAPLLIDNLDTDQIMPKQFLRRIDKAGLADGLLYDLRFDDLGQPRADCVLNQRQYSRSAALLGGANFGCGSSREHAVWGLLQYGVHMVIAPSFGEIFYNNAMNNRLLLITLPEADIARLAEDAAGVDTNRVRVDLDAMRLFSFSHEAGFTLNERHRRMFLEGLDMIGASLRHREAIAAFEAAHRRRYPWLANVPLRAPATAGMD